jgi:hypothetical protein
LLKYHPQDAIDRATYTRSIVGIASGDLRKAEYTVLDAGRESSEQAAGNHNQCMGRGAGDRKPVDSMD